MDRVARPEQPVADPARPVAAGRPLGRPPAASLLRIGGIGVLAAILIRVAFLPTVGFAYDLDQYVRWTHDLAVTPLGEAYQHPFGYPPVMVYVYAALGAVDPVFRTALTGSAAAIRVAVKLPATLADVGLALCVACSLRDRPRWALLGALAILLNPALWYLSAWWGQVDSIYLLPALIAYLLATSGRPVPAAIALGISLMTKPQALPFLVPFAAWGLARHGLRTTLAAGLTLVATVIALWLPFVPYGGPAQYVHSLSQLPGTAFNVISFQAWNIWWIVQQLAGRLLWLDSEVLIGPITFRMAGLFLAGLAELFVFVAVLRRPTARALALGLTCATLLAFAFLTTMHERYSVAALVFLAPLLPDVRVKWLWVGLSVTISANIIAAIPASSAVATVLPADGPIGIAGSLAMIALTAWCLLLLHGESRHSDVCPVAAETDPGRPEPPARRGSAA